MPIEIRNASFIFEVETKEQIYDLMKTRGIEYLHCCEDSTQVFHAFFENNMMRVCKFLHISRDGKTVPVNGYSMDSDHKTYVMCDFVDEFVSIHGYGKELTDAVFGLMDSLTVTDNAYVVTPEMRRLYKLALRNVESAITTDVGEWVAYDHQGNLQVAYRGIPLVLH